MEEKFRHFKTFRYEISGQPAEGKPLIYVLHGYGQQAQYFIRKFASLYEDYTVVAPEGMHRFYLQGASGRVGASWMTKEAREDDIADNIDWLSALDKEISERFKPSHKILLGFSQGGATAARWFHMGESKFNGMILWACVFPPDLNPEQEILNVENQHFAIGSEDEFYNTESQQELFDFYREKGFHTHPFEGKHDIDVSTLVKILKEINPGSYKR